MKAGCLEVFAYPPLTPPYKQGGELKQRFISLIFFTAARHPFGTATRIITKRKKLKMKNNTNGKLIFTTTEGI